MRSLLPLSEAQVIKLAVNADVSAREVVSKNGNIACSRFEDSQAFRTIVPVSGIAAKKTHTKESFSTSGRLPPDK